MSGSLLDVAGSLTPPPSRRHGRPPGRKRPKPPASLLHTRPGPRDDRPVRDRRLPGCPFVRAAAPLLAAMLLCGCTAAEEGRTGAAENNVRQGPAAPAAGKPVSSGTGPLEPAPVPRL